MAGAYARAEPTTRARSLRDKVITIFYLQLLSLRKKVVTLQRVSPTRPAPRELRQALIGATVPGCSGAM